MFGCDSHDFGELVAAGGAYQQSRGSTETPEVMAAFGQDCLVGDDLRAACDRLDEQVGQGVVRGDDVFCCVSAHLNHSFVGVRDALAEV